MLDPEEDESAEMCDLNDGDTVERPQASCKRRLCGEKSLALKSKNTGTSSFDSSITASISTNDSPANSPWTFCTLVAGLLFWLLSISIWMLPEFVPRTSLFWRWTKDLFICILIHPLTGFKFTVSCRKHGLHLALVNILTAGSVVCWIILLLTSIDRFYETWGESYIAEPTHILRYLTLNIQAFLLYPIWVYHLKHKHTAAEKTVGFIVFLYFCSDILGSMAAKLIGGPDLNTTFVISLRDISKKGEKDEHAAIIFLGVAFQAALMSRWNLLWIFCDIMLETDFHRHTRSSNLVLRKSRGKSLVSPVLVGGSLKMDENNVVEIWIIGTWTAFGLLHIWKPDFRVFCQGATTIFSFFAMVLILGGDSKRMRGHWHSSIDSCNRSLPWAIAFLGAISNWVASLIDIYEEYKKEKIYPKDDCFEAAAMLCIFIIIFKSSYGIMGWRRQILVSTLLSFLITILMFELAEQFESTSELIDKASQDHTAEHPISHLLKETTMWFWPELLIDTLEHMVKDVKPISS